MWPDTLTATGMLNNKKILHCVDVCCRWIYHVADKIAVNSPGFKRVLEERGVPSEKVEVIYNWTDENQIVMADRTKAEMRVPHMAGQFNIVFAGTMGKAQSLDAVLEAALIIADKLPQVQFVFVGGGIEVHHLKTKKKS